MSKFEKLGLGGTFDRLHAGHELILDLASYYSDFIQIGLISEKYLQKRPKALGKHIQPFKIRSATLIHYLKSRNTTCSIIKIDSFGKDKQIASISDLPALLVSQETYSGALVINHERSTLKKPPITIILSAIVTTDKGKKLSSSRIREELFEEKS
ncbi:MAG: pantetheine-phosphate adenylyltransferase [Candidatus Hodarchaeales archaeon]|jgi:pantetheine-phosphate adenylyltransferase